MQEMPHNVTRTVSERGRLLVNMGDRLILKSYRWLLAGVHPELEMSRFLTEKRSLPTWRNWPAR